MADPLAPQQFFNLPPTQPQSSVFGLPWANPQHATGRQLLGIARYGADSATRIREGRSQINRWQQEDEEMAMREAAKTHAAAALPYLQQLDPEDPDYLQKRMDVENYAPLAGLDPTVQRFFGIKDKVFSLRQTMERRPNPAIALELDLLKNGVPEEDVEGIRGDDGFIDIRKGSARLGEALRQNKIDARVPPRTGGGKSKAELKMGLVKAQYDLLAGLDDPSKEEMQQIQALRAEYNRLAGERLRELDQDGQPVGEVQAQTVIQPGGLVAPTAPAAPAAPKLPMTPLQRKAAAKDEEKNQKIAQEQQEIGTAWTEAKKGLMAKLVEQFPGDEWKSVLSAIYQNEALEPEDDFGGPAAASTPEQGLYVAKQLLAKLGLNPDAPAFTEPSNKRWGSNKVTQAEVLQVLAKEAMEAELAGQQVAPAAPVDDALRARIEEAKRRAGINY